jgi:hypothetical protein
MTRRWTRWTYIVLALLHLAPLCSVRYLPLGDGPTHIYNAWVLHGLVTGEAPPHIAEAYKVDWKPHPNWSGHLLMALAIEVMPPLVAEKLLLALILALMMWGTWLFATSIDPRNDVYAFLAFPFTWTQALVSGYYNFSLSIGLYLIILAVWWRRRERASIGSVTLLAVLLVLCNFTHPMATLLACGSIVLLSLLTRRFGHLPALLPVIPLLALFGRTAQSNVGEPLQLQIMWDAARILAKIETLYAFDDRHRPIAIALALTYAALIVYTLVRERRREADAIAILALALIGMMFWLPAAQGTRDLFTGRMQPFVFLILPAWFTPRIAGRWRAALFALLSIVAVANGSIAFERIRHFGRELGTMVRQLDAIEPDTTLLPLFFEDPSTLTYTNGFAHFISYVALEKRLVDFSNYEPSTHYFPIAERREMVGSFQLDWSPGAVDLAQPAAYADYVVTYALAADAPNRGSLDFLYRLVEEVGPYRIYHRRVQRGQHAEPHELVLLPLLGSRNDLNAVWRVEQTLRNRDSLPMRVVFRQCPDSWCERKLAPGEAVPIATAQPRFAYLEVPRGRAAFLDVHTVVRRVDIDRPEMSILIPATTEREFSRGGTRIEDVETGGKRIGLRIYAFGEKARYDLTLRIRSSPGDALVDEHRVTLENFGMYENGDLRSAIGGTPLPPMIDVEIVSAPDARVWAFATTTDETDRTRVYASVGSSQ